MPENIPPVEEVKPTGILSRNDLLKLLSTRLSNEKLSTKDFHMLANQFMALHFSKALADRRPAGRPKGCKNKKTVVAEKKQSKLSVDDLVKQMEGKQE